MNVCLFDFLNMFNHVRYPFLCSNGFFFHVFYVSNGLFFDSMWNVNWTILGFCEHFGGLFLSKIIPCKDGFLVWKLEPRK